jgi:hypothetical protein
MPFSPDRARHAGRFVAAAQRRGVNRLTKGASHVACPRRHSHRGPLVHRRPRRPCPNCQGPSTYERALLELDWIHGDDVPALDTYGLTDDRDILMAVATSAIEQLAAYDVDALQIELLLAALDDARALDEP